MQRVIIGIMVYSDRLLSIELLLLYLHGSNTTSCESKVGATTISKGLIVGIEKSEGMP